MTTKTPTYRILSCLTEGCGVRATARLNNVHPETVLKVLRIAGMKAEQVLDPVFIVAAPTEKSGLASVTQKIRNVRASFVQIDEAWGFVFKKDRHVTPTDHPDYGDQWAFLAITENKLIASYALGKRDPKTATAFITNLRERVTGRFRLTSDGWRTYVPIVEDVFGADIDYGWEVKDYGTSESGRERYSPSKLRSVQRVAVSGNPDMDMLTTAHVERGNLTLRTKMRRFTRLASGFSKKKAYLAAALALHIFAYNFLTVHSSLKTTPAQASGLALNAWTWADLFAS